MAAASVALEEWFDTEFLDSLHGLRLLAKRVPAGGRFAEQRSRDLGHGLEFRDYRAYSPGDDLRAIDWNIYRRLGRVFLRLFEELEDLPLYVMPDVSDSMFLEQPPRARAGFRCALALTAISLGQHDRVGIFPFAEDMQTLIRPQSGKGRLMNFARHLAGLQSSGTTNLPRALGRFSSLGLRRGVVVVISDFFDPRGLEALLPALKQIRHHLILIQLTRPSDRVPGLQGDLRLVDCESGTAEDVSLTNAVLERYQAAYDRFHQELFQFARKRHAGLLRLDVEQEVVPQLASLFESGSLVV